jgi:hypothetical protein
MPARVFTRDQESELERVGEAKLRQFSGCGNGRDYVPALERLLKDPVRAALRGRGASSPGAETVPGSLEPEVKRTRRAEM